MYCTVKEIIRDVLDTDVPDSECVFAVVLTAYSALFDHGLASKSDQRFASIRSTGNLTFSTAF